MYSYKRLANYVDSSRLKELIREAKKTGQVSDELVRAIQQIARGRVAGRVGKVDLEDYTQEATLQVLSKLHKIDVRQNVFSYITSVCWRKFLGLVRQHQNEELKMHNYYDNRRKDLPNNLG